MAEAASEQRRILELLAAGQLTVDEASELLAALGPEGAPQPSQPPVPPRPKGISRNLRIRIDADRDKGKVRVNVPLGLARFASRFLPSEAKSQLERQGIDLDGLLESLGGDLPEGKLIDIEASGDEENPVARIVVEVI